MAIPQFLIFFENNTNLLRASGVRENITGGDFLSDATINAQIKDADGANVGDPVTLSFVSGTDGIYEGSLPHDVGVEKGKTYRIEVTATQGGRQGFFDAPLHITRRTTS